MKELKQIVPRPVRSFLRERRDDLRFVARGGAEWLGYNVSRRRDCYSPLPLQSELRRTAPRWNRPSELPGVSYDLDAMKATFESLLARWQDEFNAHPHARDIKARGFGPGFPALDALTLYAMLREHRPARYIEVGSGVSTYYASLARRRNAQHGDPLAITCIEPQPYPALGCLEGIELWRTVVQDVPLERFEVLEAGDVLFIDSSHVLRLDGDVPFLFLEVVPRLAPGVLLHVHDVPFPYNCPYPAKRWVLDPSWPMFWNEAMVLQVLLTHSDRYEILLSTPMLRHFDEGLLRQRVRGYQSVDEEPDTFSSIWLRVR